VSLRWQIALADCPGRLRWQIALADSTSQKAAREFEEIYSFDFCRERLKRVPFGSKRRRVEK